MAFRLKLVPDETKIDFFRWQVLTFGISSALALLSVVALLIFGLNFGIDFKGGTTIRTESTQPIDVGVYRQALQPLNLGDVSITQVYDPGFRADQYVAQVRIGAQSGAEAVTPQTIEAVQGALKQVDPPITFPSVESVGPKVSAELIRTAVYSVLTALVAISVPLAVFVGFALWLAMAAWPGVHVTPAHLWAVLWFGLLGTSFIAFLGVLTSIWAEKFDHGAAITNFVIGPLALLSGTFYSIDRLPAFFQGISHANPFFYIISGFRYGFVAAADTNVMMGSAVLLGLNLVFGGLCYALLRRGWKIKA